MKQFQYKNQKYSVPCEWKEIPLRMVMQMARDEKEFVSDSGKQLAYISAYAGIPVDVLKHSTITEVGRLFQYLEFLSKPLPETPIFEFEFEGEKYSVAETIAKQEFQDFISLETVIADNDGNIYESLPMIIAIMAKRQGESLDDIDLDARAKLFENLPMTIAHPLSVFFCQQEQISTMLSQLSLQQEHLIRMKANEVLFTLSRRDGMAWHTRLLTSLLASWIRFTMLPQRKYSISMRPKFFITRWKQKCMKLFRKENTKSVVKHKKIS